MHHLRTELSNGFVLAAKSVPIFKYDLKVLNGFPQPPCSPTVHLAGFSNTETFISRDKKTIYLSVSPSGWSLSFCLLHPTESLSKVLASVVASDSCLDKILQRSGTLNES